MRGKEWQGSCVFYSKLFVRKTCQSRFYFSFVIIRNLVVVLTKQIQTHEIRHIKTNKFNQSGMCVKDFVTKLIDS